MPHATDREAILGVIDRRITEAKRLAARRYSEEKYCEHARWMFVSEQLWALRLEFTKPATAKRA